jgi:hypothetical protein
MNIATITRYSMLAATIGLAALASGGAAANDAQKFGRSSVYASANSSGAAKSVHSVAVQSSGRSSVHAFDTRMTPRLVNTASRTLPDNGRSSVYAWTNGSARS